MPETHRIGADRLSATISAAGAELVSLKDAQGVELLWQAGPEWPRRAPVLFPIVGRLAGDALRHEGASYRVTQHGFARDRGFDWTERTETKASLALADDAETRALYPFAFRLEMLYAIDGVALSVTSRVTNPGDAPLPFSIGAHPGFRWPLVDGVAKEAHVIDFGAQETGSRRTVEDGLLGPEAPLPFDGRRLALNEELFARDALVLPDAASRSVRYAALGPDGESLKALDFSWRGYRDLGIWSAPHGAPFLCVEPWRGMASFVGWDGPFVEKPGVVLLAPGETEEFEWRVSL
ncbi:aldose 1-epimerase family protein [Hansschlegelia zhihuaiae]|uniref:Aldose 1-epimerase family protein n=1 Tax=Hansschlegelia zhihuaiae TaxID=405005 RepID=A0A4Q0MIT2_9HYPH|nr:aldose 1-epimerase family protein [Hansschlegelia zhihuaiae]RXF73581.1 aldose 1-epimerase family protein [Hansschlegelia zhihuaiae]